MRTSMLLLAVALHWRRAYILLLAAALMTPLCGSGPILDLEERCLECWAPDGGVATAVGRP